MANGRFRRGMVVAALLPILTVLLAATTPRAGLAQDTPRPVATIRFVHAIAGGSPVDVYVDDQPRVQGLAFGRSTVYGAFLPGEHHLIVTIAGGDRAQPLIDATFDAGDGSASTVVIGTEGDRFRERVLQTDLDALEPGQARFRVVLASPDADALVVRVDTGTGTPAAGAQSAAVAADEAYRTVPAGTYPIAVQSTSGDEPPFEAPPVTMESGKVYDLLVIGQRADNSLAVLPLITSVSPPCSDLLGVGARGDACVRFVHASPDAGAIDVYVNGSLVVQGMTFGTATEFAGFGAGSSDLKVFPTGRQDAPLATGTLEVGSGQAYQVALAGIAATNDTGDDDLRLLTSEIDLTPVPPGQARIRLVNALPDAGKVALAAGATALAEGAGFGEASAYVVMPAGSYDLQVRASDGSTPLASAGGVRLEAGIAYDLFALGRAGDGSAQLLVLQANAALRQGEQGSPVPLVPATPSASPGQ